MTDLAQRLIEESEGRERCVYLDSRNLSTIGIGALVDRSVPGAGLCDEAIDVQFRHDSTRARQNAANLPGFQRCNEVRQAVLTSMCFQLGALADWPHFRAALALGDYNAAALHGLTKADGVTPSDWVTQTPKRARRQMQMLASGEWVPQ